MLLVTYHKKVRGSLTPRLNACAIHLTLAPHADITPPCEHRTVYFEREKPQSHDSYYSILLGWFYFILNYCW